MSLTPREDRGQVLPLLEDRGQEDRKLGVRSCLLLPASEASGMARPLRLEFPGALYHITARGDAHEDIYRGDGDRRMFLGLLGDVCERFNWSGHA